LFDYSFSYNQAATLATEKKDRHFDCEAFFYLEKQLYLFTKSRDPKHPKITNLYQVPVEVGEYEAKCLATFNTCEDSEC